MKKIELKEFIGEIFLMEFQMDKDVESKINEFGDLNDEIDRVKNQLKGLKKKYSGLEIELRLILENLHQHNQKSMVTEKYLISIKRMGYEKVNYRYKEVFEKSLRKVNIKHEVDIGKPFRNKQITLKTHIPQSVVIGNYNCTNFGK